MSTDPAALTIAAFQRHIAQRYEATDRARGAPRTFYLLVEEIGELATALHNVGLETRSSFERAADRDNLEEEFADVIAWLCTLANINDVDLSAAIVQKYLGDKRPEGTK